MTTRVQLGLTHYQNQNSYIFTFVVLYKELFLAFIQSSKDPDWTEELSHVIFLWELKGAYLSGQTTFTNSSSAFPQKKVFLQLSNLERFVASHVKIEKEKVWNIHFPLLYATKIVPVKAA